MTQFPVRESTLPDRIRRDLCNSQTACAALESIIAEGLPLTDDTLAMGRHPLLFTVEMYEEQLAMKVLAYSPSLNVNASGNFGHTSLHLAVEADMDALVHALVRHTAIEISLRTDDLPVGFGSVESGGQTALHIAARRGNVALVKCLLQHGACPCDTDWSGNTARDLAIMYSRKEAEKVLMQAEKQRGIFDASRIVLYEGKLKRDEKEAMKRYEASLVAPSSLCAAVSYNSFWSKEQCDFVMGEVYRTADRIGWSTNRHAAYATTDIPCYEVYSIDSWVRKSIHTRLFPFIRSQYSTLSKHTLSIRDLFFVKYEACNASAVRTDTTTYTTSTTATQNALALHQDGSTLSFNILLNSTSEFTGGGTYFEGEDRTYLIEQGGVLIHSGKLRHAGAAVLEGKRLILVAFLNVRSPDV